MSFRVFVILAAALTFGVVFTVRSLQQGLWQRGELDRITVAGVRASTRVAQSLWPQSVNPLDAGTPGSEPAGPSAAELAELAEADAVVRAERARDGTPPPQPVPVRLRLNSDEGYVSAMMHNILSERLSVTVEASNNVTGNQSSVEVTIPPESTADLVAAGLVLGHGDELIISSPDYTERKVHAN